MTLSRKARRSKSLEIDPIDDTRVRFHLGLEDKGISDAGEEAIHVLEINGELSLPELEILAIEPTAHLQPYAQCAVSLAPVRQLAGLRIGPGFRTNVLEVMGRVRGCTHFTTLVLDLAAAHTLSVFLRMRDRVPYSARKTTGDEWTRVGLQVEPGLENACIALRSDSPVIRGVKKPEE